MMAITEKAKPKKKRPVDKSQSTATKQLNRDYATGEAEAQKTYAPGSLGRVGAPTAIAPISTSMAGGSESIAQAEGNYNEQSAQDAMVKSALANLQAQTLGIGDPANNALRSSGTRAIKQNAATDSRALRASQAENNVTGGAAVGQQIGAQRQTDQQLRNFETDLLAKNVDFTQQAGVNFASAATSAAGQYSTQRNNALALLMGARKDNTGYEQHGQEVNAGIQNNNIVNSQQAEEYNLTQGEKEKAGYTGVKYGQAAVEQAYRMQQQTMALMRKQLAASGARA